MTSTDLKKKAHPTGVELADYLDRALPAEKRLSLDRHIAGCSECLAKVVSAHESVKEFNKNVPLKKGKRNIMKKINLYLIFAFISFALSFATPQYFVQLLVATLLLGTKWIVDSKSTKMLVMIYEAWKNGGEKEATRIIKKLESKRF